MHRRPFLRSLALIVLVVGSVGSASCKCPGFFNKNCSLRLDVELDEPGNVNRGHVLQVSIVLLPDNMKDAVMEKTNAAWFGGDRISEDLAKIDFSVDNGKIVGLALTEAKWQGKLEVRQVDQTRLTGRLPGLGNPDAGGFAHVAVFSDYPDLRDSRPWLIEATQVQRRNWKLDLMIGEQKVSYRN